MACLQLPETTLQRHTLTHTYTHTTTSDMPFPSPLPAPPPPNPPTPPRPPPRPPPRYYGLTGMVLADSVQIQPAKISVLHASSAQQSGSTSIVQLICQAVHITALPFRQKKPKGCPLRCCSNQRSRRVHGQTRGADANVGRFSEHSMRMPSPRLKETKGKSGKWSRSHKRWGKRFHGKKKHVENEVSVGVCLCIVCW